MVTRRIPLLLFLSAACSEEVTLVADDGTTTLTYDCAEKQSLAHSSTERDVIEEQALRIARRVSEQGETGLLTQLTEAYEDPNAAKLETLVVGYACEHGTLGEEPPPVFPEPGTLARDFSLRQLTLVPPYDDGSPVRLGDQRGLIVVLDVFGTWCAPCLQKYPVMAALARDYQGREVRFFGVLLNDSPKRAAEWFKDQGGLAYPFLLESGSDIEATWGLHGAPRMFVIDREGMIVERCLGCQSGPLAPDSLPVLLDSLLALEVESRLTSASS